MKYYLYYIKIAEFFKHCNEGREMLTLNQIYYAIPHFFLSQGFSQTSFNVHHFLQSIISDHLIGT